MECVLGVHFCLLLWIHPIFMDHSRVSAQHRKDQVKNLIIILVIFKRFPNRIVVRISSVMNSSCVSTL